jgi:hypothetical protein
LVVEQVERHNYQFEHETISDDDLMTDRKAADQHVMNLQRHTEWSRLLDQSSCEDNTVILTARTHKVKLNSEITIN